MKKLLGISIVAMLAVTPMMANAAGQEIPATPQNGDTYYAAAAANEGTNKIATTSYVKGAYNAIQTELNGIATDIDVTTNGSHISATNSVAENIVSLNTGIEANDSAIGTIGNLTGSANFDSTEAHANIVEAINTVKAQANATDALVGTSETALNSMFNSDIDTVGQALQYLKNSNNATDSKAIAVYSNWNSGGAPTRAGNDYVNLLDTTTLAGLDTTANP